MLEINNLLFCSYSGSNCPYDWIFTFLQIGWLNQIYLQGAKKKKMEGESSGLKLNIQKTKIMASGPTTSWEIDGETVETVSDFIFKLYIIVLVLPNIKMNPPQVYLCSPSWTLLPPPSPYHPSGSSQCTSPKHPVSCIEPGLATHFIHDILHVSMSFSQIIPLPSHRVQKTVLYICVSFAVSHTRLLLPSL